MLNLRLDLKNPPANGIALAGSSVGYMICTLY
jgi:hypothetical protein